jgi:protein required for attachment to host cells
VNAAIAERLRSRIARFLTSLGEARAPRSRNPSGTTAALLRVKSRSPRRRNTMTMWMVLADDGEARFFVLPPSQPPSFLQKLEHHEAREHLEKTAGHVPGQSRNDFGARPYALTPNHSLQEVERERFAAVVARRLDEAVASSHVEEIALVMPPQFLGLVRQHLGAQTKKRVVCSVNQNRVHAPLDHVAAEVRVARGVR